MSFKAPHLFSDWPGEPCREQTAYKTRQTATLTHLKIQQAGTTELIRSKALSVLSQHISKLFSCQCLSLSLSQRLYSFASHTLLSLLGLLGNAVSLASIYLCDRLSLFFWLSQPLFLRPFLIISLLCAASVWQLICTGHKIWTMLLLQHLRAFT